MVAIVAGTAGGTGTLQSTSGFGAKYGELSTHDAFTIQKKFLTISKKLITMARFAQKEVKPLNEGNEVRWRRYERFAVGTSTLSEGVTPASDTLQQTTIIASLSQYGSWVPVTDLMLALSTDPIVQQITERQAIQMAEQMDTLAWQAFRAGSNVLYAAATNSFSGTRTSVVLNIALANQVYPSGSANTSDSLIRAAVRSLESKDAVRISSVVKPSSGYNTEPVAEGFFAITHPDVRVDIEAMPGFSPIEKYANYGAVMAGEIGKVGMVRFISTTIAEPFTDNGGSTVSTLKDNGSAVKVYTTLVFAQDAVGCVSLAGQDSVVPKVVTPAPTSEDPLGQRGSCGYSYHYVCKVLQDNWLVRLEHGASKVGGS